VKAASYLLLKTAENEQQRDITTPALIGSGLLIGGAGGASYMHGNSLENKNKSLHKTKDEYLSRKKTPEELKKLYELKESGKEFVTYLKRQKENIKNNYTPEVEKNFNKFKEFHDVYSKTPLSEIPEGIEKAEPGMHYTYGKDEHLDYMYKTIKNKNPELLQKHNIKNYEDFKKLYESQNDFFHNTYGDGYHEGLKYADNKIDEYKKDLNDISQQIKQDTEIQSKIDNLLPEIQQNEELAKRFKLGGKVGIGAGAGLGAYAYLRSRNKSKDGK